MNLNHRKGFSIDKNVEGVEDGTISVIEEVDPSIEQQEEDKFHSGKIEKEDEFLEHIADSLVKAFFLAAIIKIFLYFYKADDS